MEEQGYWLNRRRLLVCSRVFVAFYLAALVTWLATDVLPAETPVTALRNDFAGFWSVGHMVLEGRTGEAYDPAAALATQAHHVPAHELRLPWFYPPQMFFLIGPLAALSYFPAFFLWSGGCLLALAWALRALAPRTPAVWLLLASPGLYWILRFGQTGVLAAAFLGGALYVMARGRTHWAGVLIGLLAFKPHLGLLLPFALLAGGQKRVFAAASLTVLGVAGACAIAFGPEIWRRFFEAIDVAMAWQARGALPPSQLVSLYAPLRVLGLADRPALALQAALAVAVLAVVLRVWHRMGPGLPAGALLAAGSLLVSPHVLGYDLVVLAPAIAILAAEGVERGWLPGEREGLILLWVWPLFSGVIAELTGFPVGVAGSLLLFALAARRCGVGPRDRPRTAPPRPGAPFSGAPAWARLPAVPPSGAGEGESAMLTVYSEDHRDHAPKYELTFGQFVPCFETPSRALMVLDRVTAVGLGAVIAPESFGRAPLARVHSEAYLAFLEAAWGLWTAETGSEADALPEAFAARGLRQVEPESIYGRLGYYAIDAAAPITPGTWQAARSAADAALTSQRRVAEGAPAAFALCRPPGHHAAGDTMGGYCYLNNAAIAAQAFSDQGAARVAVLDVDYHAGNGTQSIFYRRGDVLVASLHGHPKMEYPYFLGYAEEIGEGDGEGANLNYPLVHGTAWPAYQEALDDACAKIADYGPDALVVSLGVDTFKADPISKFRLESEHYPRIGEKIARLRRPTVFVMEGGYAVEAIGINAVGVLTGFEVAG